MYKILVLLILLCSCSNNITEEDIRQQEYGELYFTMNCWWGTQNTFSPTIVACSQEVTTELISGFVSFEVRKDLDHQEFLSICGRNIVLNTGYALHDNLIPPLTEYYNCFDAYENELGNVFDWLWDEDARVLQLIWRPSNEPDKVLTLFIDPPGAQLQVSGRVYYKTGYFN